MVLHYSLLSERDRRQYAALESLKLGRGGTTYISKILGVNRNTIRQGIQELTALAASSPTQPGRQRKAGGGRKKKDGTAPYTADVNLTDRKSPGRQPHR